MNKIPLLTIAIPTYNRSKTLEKIIRQLKTQSNQEFILLISDDLSPDNTEEMVRKYQRQTPNLVYNRNDVNLGYSGNVCKLYEMATTRYIWFVCDDDTILTNAVESIISALKKYEPVVAVFNTSWINAYGQDLVAGVEKDKIYTDAKQMETYQPLVRMTFLSIDVFERRISIEKIKKTDYRDNIFFQVTLGLMLLEDKFKFCEISSNILRRNVGYKYGEFFKFYLIDLLKAIFIVNHHFDNQKFINWSIKDLPVALQLYLSQKLGLFKYYGRPTKKTVHMIIKYYGAYSLVIAMFPIIKFLTPTILLKKIYYKKLVNIHGKKNGEIIYKSSINRAFTDKRKTGFTSYR
jgi:glycosyltransferase involved in cell wall biosynthesis